MLLSDIETPVVKSVYGVTGTGLWSDILTFISVTYLNAVIVTKKDNRTVIQILSLRFKAAVPRMVSQTE